MAGTGLGEAFRWVHDHETITKHSLPTVAAVDVVLVRWPLEQERREALAAEGHPRLLLLDGATPAPVCEDALEDWIRVPADDADVRSRIDALWHRFRSQRSELPELDPDGVLRFGGSWVSLPPVEARLMRALVDRFGAVVRRDELAGAGWPDGAPGRNALDVHVLRLRRRIGGLGLVIKTVRSRGYLLESAAEASDSGQVHVRQA